jgi:hypothetical protein
MDTPDNYWWWILSLSNVIFDFANVPEYVIKRIGANISIPDDLMNELDQWYEVISDNNISLKDELAALIKDILAISEKYGGSSSDFWTNDGFVNHPDWILIRKKSREWVENNYIG